MRLTELVHDPFKGFGDDNEPTKAEVEGRAAVREALKKVEVKTGTTRSPKRPS